MNRSEIFCHRENPLSDFFPEEEGCGTMNIARIFIGAISGIATGITFIAIAEPIDKTGFGEILADHPTIEMIWNAVMCLAVLSVMKIVVNSRSFTWRSVWCFVGFICVLGILDSVLDASVYESSYEMLYTLVIVVALAGYFETIRKKPSEGESEEEDDSWGYYGIVAATYAVVYAVVSVLIVLISNM